MGRFASDPRRLIIDVFPTIVSQRPQGAWDLDLHAWMYWAESETRLGHTLNNVLMRKMGLDPHDVPTTFRERVQGFSIENVRRRQLRLSIGDFTAQTPLSRRNGHVISSLLISDRDIQSGLKTTVQGDRILEFQLEEPLRGEAATGKAFVLPAHGVSIISDIDDTIKDTGVGDKQQVLANTFLREFRPVREMVPFYQSLRAAGVLFHYVSASPWQLYHHLAEFLERTGYPAGSIHLRKFTLKDVTILKKLSPTYKGKRRRIENLLTRAPLRSFILIGDSGEKDPEMYVELARRFPSQVKGIYIRDVGRGNHLARWDQLYKSNLNCELKLFRDPEQIQPEIMEKVHQCSLANTSA